MVGESFPEQFEGGRIPFQGEVVDYTMLDVGDPEKGIAPLRDDLTEGYGQQGVGWDVVSHKPSRWIEQMAVGAHIPLFEVAVLPAGLRRARQQRMQ